MNQLIWFSIPGAILLSTVYSAGLFDGGISNFKITALLLLMSPLVGFIIHQVWRTIFELIWGFHSKHRLVIKKIMRQFGVDNKVAFLIWELTFYSDAFPASFRNHDKGAWNYIMSFCSCALAAIVCIIISAFSTISYAKPMLALYTLLVLAFLLKAITTLKSLNRQEVGILSIYKELFLNIKEKIVSEE